MSKEFDDLLGEIPKIAEAVNRFDSEAVQAEVFDALLRAWAGEAAQPAKERKSKPVNKKKSRSKEKNETEASTQGTEPTSGKKTSGKKKKRKRSKRSYSIVAELDLRPDEEESFKEFIGKRTFSTHLDKVVLATYYLEKVLRLSPVSVDHVFTVFRTEGWKLPSNLQNTVSKTGVKDWIDSSSFDDLQVLPPGLNYVEHDLRSDE